MPDLEGRFVPVLRVSNLEASAEWYARVLRLGETSRYSPVAGAGQVVLEDPSSGLTLCLVADGAPGHEPSDDRLLGLDHLEVLVPTIDQLARWVQHLDELHVPHSGVKEPHYSQSAMVTFRDPDNIQLELFCLHR